MKTGFYFENFVVKTEVMKEIKIIFCGLAAFFVVGCFCACTEKNTEEDDVVAMVLTVCKNASGAVYLLDDDTVTTYQPSPALVLHDSLVGRRCYVEYSCLSSSADYTYTINLTYAHIVCEEAAVAVASDEAMAALGDAALNTVWAWISGHYLNVLFDYYGTSFVEHKFSLAHDVRTATAADSVWTVELRHHLNGDAPNALMSEVVSFDLVPLAMDSAAVSRLRVKYRTFDGTDAYADVAVPTYLRRQAVAAKHFGAFRP